MVASPLVRLGLVSPVASDPVGQVASDPVGTHKAGSDPVVLELAALCFQL